MSNFAAEIADACRTAIGRFATEKSHPQVFPAPCKAFILRLREWFQEGRLSINETELAELSRLVNEGDDKTVGFHHKKDSEVRKIITERYRILIPEETCYRISNRGDLGNSAAFGGDEILKAPTEAAVVDRIAHNHFLVFPEIFRIFQVVGKHWRPASSLDDLIDVFHFVRKINGTTIDYIQKELLEYRVLQRRDEKLKLNRVPPSALAYLITDSYLLLSGHRADVGIRASDLFTQLGSYILEPETQLRSSWQEKIRANGTLLTFEVGGTQTRITSESLIWLAAHGMVDPASIGLILKRCNATKLLSDLAREMSPVVNQNSPKNAREYLSCFLT